ncbi:16S rRNA (guanine(527)-N(7))-methyltransferase RsmG [Geobacter sp. DSM 9736]|uniref:16S rRNA (guanine(527)-N(7))-methyltransferase RsmG n=1 Tax=Geobacter sp. DSM 9736 TaxID=1277350 RepID=UPI000B5040CA|nr:16S rRNA (guanine(527)-N(7))-methyltransferase RsmG [Geobacter sp. DSM 9736]SNB47291.1 16S rRNA m(7)G-527 methyltransferase [Geobacter sp. DSM 9736]
MNDKAKDYLLRGAAEIGVQLSEKDLTQFSLLATELKKWGKKINLTAILDDPGIAVKHFLDSLTLLKFLEGGGRLLDIGSGAGFPAFPLKIVRGGLDVVTVDAVEKKVIFQRNVARLLGLHNFEALHARGEELSGKYPEGFDWIVSRAFSEITSFVEIALPLVKKDGLILAMKGRGGEEEARDAEPALSEMGVSVHDVVVFQLPIAGDARSIVIMRPRRS